MGIELACGQTTIVGAACREESAAPLHLYSVRWGEKPTPPKFVQNRLPHELVHVTPIQTNLSDNTLSYVGDPDDLQSGFCRAASSMSTGQTGPVCSPDGDRTSDGDQANVRCGTGLRRTGGGLSGSDARLHRSGRNADVFDRL